MSGKKLGKGKRFWKRTLKEFEGCGLSVKKFCELKGVGASTFYQWRSHFNNRLNYRELDQGRFTPLSIIGEDLVEDRALTSRTIIDDGIPSDKQQHDDESMVPVVEESKKRNSSGPKASLKEGFDLHIGEKLKVRVPFGFDELELKRLVGVLC